MVKCEKWGQYRRPSRRRIKLIFSGPGIGLHSYGFTEAAFKWLVLFVASQLAFIALGLMPGKF